MSSTSITESYITSQDGTRIGYLQRGSGPGLVLVQGAMGTAYNYDDLANVLASSFTVYTPDRRGRGMSPKPYTADYTIARDVEDIDALLAATGASRVFGLSSGAMITLEAVRTLPRITQAAVYEPPFYRDGISHTGIQALNAEIESGNLGTGLVTTLATTQMVPAADKLPKPIARILGGFALWVDDRRPGPYARIRNLLPSVQ
jgi:pimeloyl-ACP methyl ester carboxylesterase